MQILCHFYVGLFTVCCKQYECSQGLRIALILAIIIRAQFARHAASFLVAVRVGALLQAIAAGAQPV